MLFCFRLFYFRFKSFPQTELKCARKQILLWITMRMAHIGYFNHCLAGGERWFWIGLPRPNGVHEYESGFFYANSLLQRRTRWRVFTCASCCIQFSFESFNKISPGFMVMFRRYFSTLVAYELALRRHSLALELANVSICSSDVSQAANEKSRLKGPRWLQTSSPLFSSRHSTHWFRSFHNSCYL